AFGIFHNASFACCQAAATKLDVVSCAAQQPVWAVWCVFCFATFPLNQAATVFLPRAGGPQAARHLGKLILGLAFGFGLVMASCHGFLAGVTPGLLAKDSTLWPTIRTLALPGAIALILCGISQVLEGILLTLKQSKFLACCHGVNFCLVYFGAQYVVRAGMGIQGVWALVVGMYIFRACQCTARLLPIWRKAHSDGPALANLEEGTL
ncbi:unnamed protein product, partial [Polarella glacialis]